LKRDNKLKPCPKSLTNAYKNRCGGERAKGERQKAKGERRKARGTRRKGNG